ncbi:VU91B calmodulin [Pelomyxa schiedti]|nr:VU91B calmodulin [Pelomyxa schiedti]
MDTTKDITNKTEAPTNLKSSKPQAEPANNKPKAADSAAPAPAPSPSTTTSTPTSTTAPPQQQQPPNKPSTPGNKVSTPKSNNNNKPGTPKTSNKPDTPSSSTKPTSASSHNPASTATSPAPSASSTPPPLSSSTSPNKGIKIDASVEELMGDGGKPTKPATPNANNSNTTTTTTTTTSTTTTSTMTAAKVDEYHFVDSPTRPGSRASQKKGSNSKPGTPSSPNRKPQTPSKAGSPKPLSSSINSTDTASKPDTASATHPASPKPKESKLAVETTTDSASKKSEAASDTKADGDAKSHTAPVVPPITLPHSYSAQLHSAAGASPTGTANKSSAKKTSAKASAAAETSGRKNSSQKPAASVFLSAKRKALLKCASGASCHFEGGSNNCTKCGRAAAITTDQLFRAHALFTECDLNHNGTIEANEVAVLLRRYGLNPSMREIKEAVGDLDTDKNGKLSFDEFFALALALKPASDPATTLLEAFRLFDTSGDGVISANELRQALISQGEPLTPEEAESLISIADKNGDGKLDIKEFLILLQ